MFNIISQGFLSNRKSWYKSFPVAFCPEVCSGMSGLARVELAEAIGKTEIKTPVCPVYQNVDAMPSTDPSEIKDKLLRQLTSPVRWTQTVLNMHHDGATEFVELGPGNVLQGLIKKCLPNK